MASVFLITFIMMLIIVLIMAVGYIFQRKTIAGSCGGIASLGIEKVCNCEEPCEKRKAKMAKEELRKRATKNQNEININVQL